MARLFYVAFALGLSAVVLTAQPHLSMPVEQNWGVVVPQGITATPHQVKARVELKNDGTEPLKVKEVRVGCGCTSAPLEKDSLAPGETTYLNITLNLPNGNGPITKYVTIFTNEPSESTHVLNLKVDVQRPIQLSSGFIAFNAAVVGRVTQGVITISSYNASPVRISVLSQVPDMTVEPAEPFTLAKGESKDVFFRFTPKSTGSFNVQAVLKADLPGYEDVPIVGYGMVTEREGDVIPGTMKIGD